MSTETESISTLPMQPPRGKWLAAVLLFLLSLLILFFASLQYYWPGKWWGGAEAMGWQGGALTLAKGKGYVTRGKLVVEGLAEPGVAVTSLSPPAFRAEDYPVVRWSVSSSDDKPATKVEFLWSTAENPERFFSRQLDWQGNSIAPLHLEGDTHWRGQVARLALMVHAPLERPLVIDAVEFEPFSPLGIVWREWFGAEPWLGTSINFVGGSNARQWLAPLPFVAVALGLALFGYWLSARGNTLVADTRMLWVLVFAAWFALDMRWQFDLWQKLGLTQQRYAGKSWAEKHLAAEDGRLFDLMRQVRAKLPAGTQSRVFLIAEEEYTRKRAAYHLYPFNVLNLSHLISPRRFKSGDFIIILGKDELEFDLSKQLLKWEAGQQLSAELLLVAENNVLLKVR